MEFYCFETPLGAMALGQEGEAIVQLYLPGQPTPRIMPHPTPLLKEGERQLLEYFRGERHTFDLPLAPEGTPFQRGVWKALVEIPWGQTCSYGDIARRVGCPGGARAVGQANRKNPIPILVPCHRVIATDGSLGGYAYGLPLKEKLLELEGGRREW